MLVSSHPAVDKRQRFTLPRALRCLEVLFNLGIAALQPLVVDGPDVDRASTAQQHNAQP